METQTMTAENRTAEYNRTEISNAVHYLCLTKKWRSYRFPALFQKSKKRGGMSQQEKTALICADPQLMEKLSPLLADRAERYMRALAGRIVASMHILHDDPAQMDWDAWKEAVEDRMMNAGAPCVHRSSIHCEMCNAIICCDGCETHRDSACVAEMDSRGYRDYRTANTYCIDCLEQNARLAEDGSWSFSAEEDNATLAEIEKNRTEVESEKY